MNIAKIEAHILSCVMPEPVILPFKGGIRTIYKRDVLITKVTTDNGLTGYGPGPASEPMADKINGDLCFH